MGAGKLWAAALGGQPVWNLIAGGDALMQAATCQVLAHPGEYVLSDAALQALANARARHLDSIKMSADVPLPIPPLAWLSSFLPPQLHEAAFAPSRVTVIGHGNSELAVDPLLRGINEIRPVSAVFVRITGLDSRAPPALSQLQALCVSLQENLRARGGPLGELYLDEKGLIFSCAFGARGNFHRDDPYRAISAARAMDETISGVGLTASIGVATGHALFCVVGNARRRQLMVHGAAVNRAARLMTAISAGVVCDAPTERASRTAFSFEQRGTLQLDGLGDMAAVFRPLEPRVTAAVPSTLIGRETEQAVLGQLFEETCAGGTRLLAVLGEPGIGKTALVTAFMEELQRLGPKSRSPGRSVKTVVHRSYRGGGCLRPSWICPPTATAISRSKTSERVLTRLQPLSNDCLCSTAYLALRSPKTTARGISRDRTVPTRPCVFSAIW